VIDSLNISKWSREVPQGIHQGGVTAVNATAAVLEDFRRTDSHLSPGGGITDISLTCSWQGTESCQESIV